MTSDDLAALAASNPILAETTEMPYMTERPALPDSRDTRQRLGPQATPIDEVIAEIVKTGGTLTVPAAELVSLPSG